MYLIYKDGDVVERAETLRYVKHQENGVAVFSALEDYDAVYSPATDTMYSLAEYGVEREGGPTAERLLAALLGEEVNTNE